MLAFPVAAACAPWFTRSRRFRLRRLAVSSAHRRDGKRARCRALRHRVRRHGTQAAAGLGDTGRSGAGPATGRRAVEGADDRRSEEPTSELQSLMRITYAV